MSEQLGTGDDMPRVVTDPDELRALPIGSVILTMFLGRVGKIMPAKRGKMIVWAETGDNLAALNSLVAKAAVPATVLHEAQEPRP